MNVRRVGKVVTVESASQEAADVRVVKPSQAMAAAGQVSTHSNTSMSISWLAAMSLAT
jgi:transcription elongation GreA/GreB family factor